MQRGPALRRSRFLESNRLATTFDNYDGKELSTESLEKGFQLACFLFPDYATAIDILSGALEKLEVQCQREKKRLFWRDKHPAQPVRRMTRKDSDMLQWLILLEAEEYEIEQERAGSPSTKDMIVRYIKYLAQITTAMSSFYVNIGLTRLLHNYSTSEAQYTYETLTHRYLGPDEYRRAKAALMDRINKRFSKFLKVTRVQHGELRFEACDDQQRWGRLVNECLKAFTPWSTEKLCSELTTISSNSKLVPPEIGADDADQNAREMNWCHVLLEPTCYGRLMKELALDMPENRLSLPKFSMLEKSEKSDDSGTRQNRAAALSQDVRDALRKRLAETEQRRRKWRGRSASVIVDGVPRAQLDLVSKGQLQINIEEGANLVEIRGEDDHGSLLLATHFISYAENAFEFSKATAVLNNSRLELSISPVVNSSKGLPQATLTVNYHPKFNPVLPWTAWQALPGPWAPVWSYALTGLVLAVITWGVTSAFYKHRITLLERTNERPDHTRQLQTEAHAPVHYLIVPDDQRVRTQERIGIPTVSLQSHPQVVILDLQLTGAKETAVYTADLETFSGDRRLMTQNFLRAKGTETGSIISIIVPADLLEADKYYTVELYSMGTAGPAALINRFTFKVISSQ